jgi:hypothetical protein
VRQDCDVTFRTVARSFRVCLQLHGTAASR